VVKEISDTDSACIGCGRPITKTVEKSESVVNETDKKKTTTVERKGGKYELIGFAIILLSMGGCSVTAVSGSVGVGMGVGNVGFLIGLVVFITGRFS